ncbi:MAG: polysaccharide biosynthesis/export family protein [Roseobacter sp.]
MPFQLLFRLAVFIVFICSGGLVSANSDIKLAPGDTLSFWIIGAIETPREVMIQPDGNVMLPLVGTLDVDTLTIAQAREKLNNQLKSMPVRITGIDGREQRLGLRANEVGLDVARFRPVYISGEVQLVGEVQYTPNLTARQAIVKAGGYFRFASTDSNFTVNLSNQSIRLEKERDESRADLQRLIAQYSILNPDIDLSKRPDIAAVLGDSPTGGGEFADLISIEEDLFEREIEDTDRSLEQLQARVNVVEDLKRTSEATVEIAEANVERLANLAAQGLLRSDLMDNARQTLLQAQTRALESASEGLRLDLEISKLRGSEVIDDLEASSRLLLEIRAELVKFETAQLQLENLELMGARTFTANSETTTRQVLLTRIRTVEGQTSEQVIALDEFLSPGDVLDVSFK